MRCPSARPPVCTSYSSSSCVAVCVGWLTWSFVVGSRTCVETFSIRVFNCFSLHLHLTAASLCDTHTSCTSTSPLRDTSLHAPAACLCNTRHTSYTTPAFKPVRCLSPHHYKASLLCYASFPPICMSNCSSVRLLMHICQWPPLHAWWDNHTRVQRCYSLLVVVKASEHIVQFVWYSNIPIKSHSLSLSLIYRLVASIGIHQAS